MPEWQIGAWGGMGGLLQGLKALAPRQLAALGVVGAATLGLMALMVWRATAPAPMVSLYAGLDLRDASAMTGALDKAHIAHQESPDGTSVRVPRNQLAAARLLLARAGLPNDGTVGYEIFDHGGGFAMTQFEQDINETRALEGELSRSILLIAGVRGVRVHLVLPRHEPFDPQQQRAQASVLLTMAGPAPMDPEGVRAILNLVAAAVPGLRPKDIAIIDSRGNLLARAGQPLGADGGGGTPEEIRQAMEARIDHAVEAILEPSLGAGHVRAEATVDLDFDHTHETDQKYDPDGQVARSTQTLTDQSKANNQPDTVSVQNNLPNPGQSGGGGGSSDSRHEETTNYEISHTTREVVHEAPRVQRLSLAVLVDGIATPGPGGKPVWHARSAEEISRLTALVKSAVGFDARRGDTISVVSMRFDTQDTLAAAPPPSLVARLLGATDLGRLLQILIFGGIALVALLTVLRPAAMKLAAGGPATPGVGPVRLAGGQALLEAPDAPADAEEVMMNVESIDGQIRASSIRRIADLIEKQPEESLAVIRGWMAQDAA